jgi:hypothetical protein
MQPTSKPSPTKGRKDVSSTRSLKAPCFTGRHVSARPVLLQATRDGQPQHSDRPQCTPLCAGDSFKLEAPIHPRSIGHANADESVVEVSWHWLCTLSAPQLRRYQAHLWLL